MTYLLLFLAGAFLCNFIPHLVAALQGVEFPTPFARPRGVGSSPPLVNFAWGSANLLLGVLIMSGRVPFDEPVPDSLAFALGFLATGAYLSLHFGKVRSGRAEANVKAGG